MRANLDTENRNMLTKKFWSHIKTTNKSTKIPEVVSCVAIATSDPTTKANLFNDYFREQFLNLLATTLISIFEIIVTLM